MHQQYKMARLIVSFVLFIQVYAQYDTDNSFGKECTSPAECDTSIGQTCWKHYAACKVGTCLCHPTAAKWDGKKCKKVLKDGDHCEQNSDCLTGLMHCKDNHCRCEVGRATPDRRYCLRDHERLVGTKCTFKEDKCYRKDDSGTWLDSETLCYQGECKCSGMKYYNIGNCKKYKLGDSGCTEAYHCHSRGAMCSNGKCVCPTGYMAVAKDTKCAPRSAVLDLKEGEVCTERKEEQYCGYGLDCHLCIGQKAFKCLTPSGHSGSSHSYVNTLIIAILFTSFILLDR